MFEQTHRTFKKILDEGTIPENWKTSNTILIPKQNKPTIQDFRPLALTNIVYKLYMSIIKERIEKHLRENNMNKEEQAGFTTGRQVEDNVMILKYCIDSSYKNKKTSNRNRNRLL